MGAIQYLSKYLDNLSAQTDSLRQLLKKNNNWIWAEEHTLGFENLKQKITEIPCLAHYNSDYPDVITTDASTKGLGATLWQEQPNGSLKPIGFASRFLSDTEKKYAINELELLALVWGLEHFRLYIYDKPINLLTDYQALEPLIKRNRSNKTYSARLTYSARSFHNKRKPYSWQTLSTYGLSKQKSGITTTSGQYIRRRIRNYQHSTTLQLHLQVRLL